jgi:inorganic pyrophosphatase
MNPWHQVNIGDGAPEVVTAIIEITKNSKAKYELDKESGMLILDRVLFSAMRYPENYGFIPKTYCDDGDPLDVLVISQVGIVPMCLVEARVVGVMQMIDGGEMDDKIIAVAANDPSMADINDLADVPSYILKEIKVFFEDYKKLEKKVVEVKEFEGKEKALEIIRQSMVDYTEKFGEKAA